jgi:hypothetical protein
MATGSRQMGKKALSSKVKQKAIDSGTGEKGGMRQGRNHVVNGLGKSSEM